MILIFTDPAAGGAAAADRHSRLLPEPRAPGRPAGVGRPWPQRPGGDRVLGHALHGGAEPGRPPEQVSRGGEATCHHLPQATSLPTSWSAAQPPSWQKSAATNTGRPGRGCAFWFQTAAIKHISHESEAHKLAFLSTTSERDAYSSL